jgi:hypothetical protein
VPSFGSLLRNVGHVPPGGVSYFSEFPQMVQNLAEDVTLACAPRKFYFHIVDTWRVTPYDTVPSGTWMLTFWINLLFLLEDFCLNLHGY